MLLEIIPMSVYNIEAVADVERRCFASPWSLNALESELSNPMAVFRVAVLDGEVIGYAGMHDIHGEGYVTNVAVLPEHRRQGVAKALVCELIRYGRENSLDFITLEVRASNAVARALYRGLGFEEAGLRRAFYTLPSEDGVIMTLKLNSKEGEALENIGD